MRSILSGRCSPNSEALLNEIGDADLEEALAGMEPLLSGLSEELKVRAQPSRLSSPLPLALPRGEPVCAPVCAY